MVGNHHHDLSAGKVQRPLAHNSRQLNHQGFQTPETAGWLKQSVQALLRTRHRRSVQGTNGVYYLLQALHVIYRSWKVCAVSRSAIRTRPLSLACFSTQNPSLMATWVNASCWKVKCHIAAGVIPAGWPG